MFNPISRFLEDVEEDDELETPEEARAVAKAKADRKSYSLDETRKLLDLYAA